MAGIVLDTNTFYILIMLIIGMGAILFLGFILVATTHEAWFWLMRRFSGKVAVMEFDDSGRVVFKAEKPIGQGIYQGEEPREYSFQPRSLGGNVEKAIKQVTDDRFGLYVQSMSTAAKINGGATYTPPPDLYESLRKQVEFELKGGRSALELATTLNNYRAYTWGLKTPLFVRYSGKAINVNPAVAVVASQDPNDNVTVATQRGPLTARVTDLKNWFSVMVTPSQVRSVTTRSELIGARQLGSKPSLMPFFLLLGILVVMVVMVFVVLPQMGIKVF
jgi:hypothetical protein